ncbi:hypothetical protein DV735_g5604, partial [Chaetothyriales sp. CBS 134920]
STTATTGKFSAMASTTSPALKQWTSIIKRWPVDKVRPQNVAFQTIMQNRIDHLVKPASKSDGADRELRQAKILNTLLENKYATAFPLSSALRHPASNPTYYDDLLRELEEAPTRSYFSKVMNRIRGVLRFK